MAVENNPIPNEVLLVEFGFFTPRELLIVARVNRQWRSCADDNKLWKRFILLTVKPHPEASYKKLYRYSPQYRVPQLRLVSAETDRLLNKYAPLDKDKLMRFLTDHPKLIDYLLFHPDPNVIQLIDNIVLTHIAKIDKSKIITIVQCLDTRITAHLNRHLLMHFIDTSPEVVPHILNHPHDAVVTEINDKLLMKAFEKYKHTKELVLTHTSSCCTPQANTSYSSQTGREVC